MRLFTGKRIGQSGGELTAAVSFSLFLHLIAFLAALYVSFHISGRIAVPLIYRVNLVALPADAPLISPSAPQAASALKAPEPKHAPPAPHAKQQVRAVPAPKAEPAPKQAMPELGAEKKVQKPAEAPLSAPSAPAAGAAGRKEAVAVQGPSEFAPGSAFEWYSNNVKMKIRNNWQYPYARKEASATVVFTILRSGLLQQVRLEKASGVFAYDQAALRAIQLSSPFPPLPEDFTKSSVTFVVDLQPEN